MKKIFYYVMALALGCSQMSCSDLLDQKPDWWYLRNTDF